VNVRPLTSARDFDQLEGLAVAIPWGFESPLPHFNQIPNPNLRIPISERRDVPATTRYCGQVAAPSKLMIVCDGSVGTSGRRKAKPDAL